MQPPAPPEIVQCNSCKGKFKRGSPRGGNTFGAILYSDGKMIGPMLSDELLLVKCPSCNAFLWINEADLFDIDDKLDFSYRSDNHYAETLFPEETTIVDYFEALEQMAYRSKEEEAYIRKQIWWAYNDRVREGKTIFQQENDSFLYKDNIQNLQTLLNEAIDEEILLKAESHRNIGEFDRCHDLLNKLQDIESLKWLKDKIVTACNEKSTKVFQLN